MKLSIATDTIVCGAIVLLAVLFMDGPVIVKTWHDLVGSSDQKANTMMISSECQNPQTIKGSFSGKTLYRCAFENVMYYSLALENEAKRKTWAAEWEHKHDSDHALDTPKSSDNAVDEMVQSLGERFNYYFDAAETKDNSYAASGSVGEIGITLSGSDEDSVDQSSNTARSVGNAKDIDPAKQPHSDAADSADDTEVAGDDGARIQSVVANSPAAKEGLVAGDIVQSVDGNPVSGETLESIAHDLKGDPGTKVSLTVKHGGLVKTYAITREEVSKPVVTDARFVADKVFYTRLSDFDSVQMKHEMDAVVKKAVEAKAVILDLRANGGGLDTNELYLIELFLNAGVYDVHHEREGSKSMDWTTFLLPNLEMKQTAPQDFQFAERQTKVMFGDNVVVIVLLDHSSASASEGTAGALQANHRATIIGESSYGKGVEQSEVDLPFGRSAHIISGSFRPGGMNVDWTGVAPDLTVSLDRDGVIGDLAKDKPLAAAIAEARRQIAQVEAKEEARQKQSKEQHQQFLKEVEQRKAKSGNNGVKGSKKSK